jgi:hypothetical protein
MIVALSIIVATKFIKAFLVKVVAIGVIEI